MSIKYDVDYFIAKFEAIPDERWCTGAYTRGDQHCAAGHCGADDGGMWNTEESRAFYNLTSYFKSGDNFSGGPAIVNDGKCPMYQQATPKARTLACLRDIKAKEAA